MGQAVDLVILTLYIAVGGLRYREAGGGQGTPRENARGRDPLTTTDLTPTTTERSREITTGGVNIREVSY